MDRWQTLGKVIAKSHFDQYMPLKKLATCNKILKEYCHNDNTALHKHENQEIHVRVTHIYM